MLWCLSVVVFGLVCDRAAGWSRGSAPAIMVGSSLSSVGVGASLSMRSHDVSFIRRMYVVLSVAFFFFVFLFSVGSIALLRPYIVVSR